MDMTEMKNLVYCNKALALKKDIEGHFMLLSEYLYRIKEFRLYEPQWSSWLEFVYEMKISPNMANKLVQIYKTFILGYGFNPDDIATVGGWSSVQEILPVITSKEDAYKWLDEAKNLTVSDLRKSVKEAKTGINMSSCSHKNSYLVRVCKDCGERHQEFEEHVSK